jgi:hypothetical protein
MAFKKQEGWMSEVLMTLHSIDAVKATTAGFGVYAGLLGIEHGCFETLQGNAVPKGLKILAVSPSELPFPFGHEPAMTVVPSFLVTGILAIAVGLSIILWSAAFLHSRHGAAVLFLLSALLLLFGGGFGPISLLITACIGATKINKPLTWWRSHFPVALRRTLANLWPWFFAAALLWVPAELAAGQLFDLKNDHRQTLTNLNLMLSYPMLAFFALSLIAGFARELQRQMSLDNTPPTTGAEVPLNE